MKVTAVLLLIAGGEFTAWGFQRQSRPCYNVRRSERLRGNTVGEAFKRFPHGSPSQPCLRRRSPTAQGAASSFHVQESVTPLVNGSPEERTAVDGDEVCGDSKSSIAERRSIDSMVVKLALPAMCGALIDPLLSLVDSGFVGRLGSESLGALGPACEIFTFCFAMSWALRDATCSLLANSLARGDDRFAARLVRTSLGIGLGLGVVVAILLRVHATALLGIMGLARTSPMFAPASVYLRTRALAFPTVVLLTVAEGAFRGSGDTRSPVLAGLVAGAANVILDPFLMFRRGMGMRGAAAATAIAQVCACAFALYRLLPRTQLADADADAVAAAGAGAGGAALGGGGGDMPSVLKTSGLLLSAGGAMFVRTASILTYWTIATSLATRLGTTAVAAHHVALQIWLFFVLPVEGPAVANQVLLPRYLAGGGSSDDNGAPSPSPPPSSAPATTAAAEVLGEPPVRPISRTPPKFSEEGLEAARRLLARVLRLSVLSGVSMACILAAATPAYPPLFALSPAVAVALLDVIPLAAGLLPIVASNMVLESFLTGARNFRYLALGTACATGLSSALIVALSRTPEFSVKTIWVTICGFFALRSSIASFRVWGILRKKKGGASSAEI